MVDGNMADHVDLNFGCPVPKVTRRGGGSALFGKPTSSPSSSARGRRMRAGGHPRHREDPRRIDHNHETFLEAGHIAQEEAARP